MSVRVDRVKIALTLIAFLFRPSVAHAWDNPPSEVAPVIRDGIEYLVWGPLPKPDEIASTSLEARELRTGRQLWAVKLYDNKGKPNVEHYLPHVWVKSMEVTDGQIGVVNSKGDVIKVDPSSGRIIVGAGHSYYGDEEVGGQACGGLLGLKVLAIAGVLTVFFIAVSWRAFKAGVVRWWIV